jgi:hypothetical protein
LEAGGDEGSEGFHFEKTHFGDEIMVSDESLNPVISRMSLAVAKDSGWYDIDLDKGQSFKWGKEKGCNMFNYLCFDENINEYCETVGTNACSNDHLYEITCQQSVFTERCPININIKSCKTYHGSYNDIYYYGLDSSCLSTFV